MALDGKAPVFAQTLTPGPTPRIAGRGEKWRVLCLSLNSLRCGENNLAPFTPLGEKGWG